MRNAPSIQENPVNALEIAVFQAKDPNTFVAKQPDVHRLLGELFDGYVASLGLRSASDPAVFADLVVWSSTEAATAAAASLGDQPELAWFHDEVESIRFFDHFDTELDNEMLTTLSTAPAIELALLKPADAGAFAVAQQSLHTNHLAHSDQVISNTVLSLNSSGVTGDLMGWMSAGAMESMAPKMMAEAELVPVFDPANEMMLFMAFNAPGSS